MRGRLLDDGTDARVRRRRGRFVRRKRMPCGKILHPLGAAELEAQRARGLHRRRAVPRDRQPDSSSTVEPAAAPRAMLRARRRSESGLRAAGRARDEGARSRSSRGERRVPARRAMPCPWAGTLNRRAPSTRRRGRGVAAGRAAVRRPGKGRPPARARPKWRRRSRRRHRRTGLFDGEARGAGARSAERAEDDVHGARPCEA